jgi:alcohol dehydrogenase class IV
MAITVGLSQPGPESFLAWLGKLKAEVGIPANLTSAKVSQDVIEKLCDFAIQDGCHGSNPKVCTREDFKRVFSESF